jgi:signal transduction histidine kinase
MNDYARNAQPDPGTASHRYELAAVRRNPTGRQPSDRPRRARSCPPPSRTRDSASNEVMSILDETSQVMAYSRELEQKRRELEHATRELREANERLQDLDRMKDDFVSTVSHELRTPLTAIRAFAEILHHSPERPLPSAPSSSTSSLHETERLTRLIDQILDLARMESGRAEWTAEPIDPSEIVREAAAATEGLFRSRAVRLQLTIPPQGADRPGRSRPHDAGPAESAHQRGKILHARDGPRTVGNGSHGPKHAAACRSGTTASASRLNCRPPSSRNSGR